MMDDTEAYEIARSLDAATAHLSLAAELGNIIIWRHDLKSGRVEYNDRGYQFIGSTAPPGGFLADDIRQRIHPDDFAGIAASAERALRSGRPVDETARYRRGDGVWRTMLSRRVVERDIAGAALAFEQAEQGRRAQRLAERLEAAARAGRMGIWSTTPGTGETEWNAQMFELFDRIDGPASPTLREWLTCCVHADDAVRVAQAIRDYPRGDAGALEIEFRIRSRDDRIRWIVLRADIDDAEAGDKRIFGIAMDVTDQHEVQTALQAASQRSSLIAQHAGIGTWETDVNSSNALWDDQMFRLRGLAPRSTALDREERLALLHPEDRAIPLDADPKANAGVPATAYEFRVLWPDGSVHWLASRSAPLLDEHGQVVRRMGVNWDITESKNAELARQQAQLAERESQAKSRFLSRMSHELRTPLNAVLGFTQLLQADARGSAAHERLLKLNHIRAAGEHLLALINDALDLSSLESGMLKLDLQPVAIEHAITRALPLLDTLSAAKEVTVRRAGLQGVALADPARLHQVLVNLLGNAIKNNRPGGEVLIGAQASGAQVTLQVIDRGRRLQPEQLAHLFEPFNRLGIEGEGIEGTGIGLTIARAMVESMAGEIAVTSEAGVGTVFELNLPSAAIGVEAPVWSALAPHANAASTPPDRDGCLLYIEDNEVNVLLVEELVKSIHGLRFIAETTGDAGVATAARLRPDLILVDLQLPDFDGFEVLRRLRAQPATAAIPCIALSANAMPEDIERGRAAGFDDYWTKPIRFKPFIDALERLFPPADVHTTTH
jgi:signal transduction histidine kinase/CheY-like chemotaxis protein